MSKNILHRAYSKSLSNIQMRSTPSLSFSLLLSLSLSLSLLISTTLSQEYDYVCVCNRNAASVSIIDTTTDKIVRVLFLNFTDHGNIPM